MAAPSFVAASAGTTDAAGAWSHTGPAPGAVGRVLIVHILQDGLGADALISSVTNAERLDGTDGSLTFFNFSPANNVGDPQTATQILYIGRSTSTSAMVITGTNSSGGDVYVRVYEFQNVNTGTNLSDVIENGTAGAFPVERGTGTTVSDVSVQTLGPDRLALNFVGIDDDATGLGAFTGETGGDWTLATAIYESSTGTDATIGLMQATMATAGTINGGSATITSDNWGVVGFALIGTTPSVATPHYPAIVFQDPAIV